jgi:hypothetical protein
MTSLNELLGKELVAVLGDSTPVGDRGGLGNCGAELGDDSSVEAALGTIARLVRSAIDMIGDLGSGKRGWVWVLGNIVGVCMNEGSQWWWLMV